MSSFFYYGPGAWEAALARQEGTRRVGGPFGEGGLKIEDARVVVALSNQLPPGRQKCTVVVGPLNKATPASADVLLKSIEEPPKKLEIILWSEDLNGVPPTIISRCWPMWCPGEESCRKVEEANLLAVYFSEGKFCEVAQILSSNKEELEELCKSLALVLSESNFFKEEDLFLIWSKVRLLLKRKKISYLDLCSSLLFGH